MVRMQIAMANKVIIPAAVAAKFPTLEVNFSAGETLKLPIVSNGDGNVADAGKSPLPKASLLCLSFRANSQVYNFKLYFDELC